MTIADAAIVGIFFLMAAFLKGVTGLGFSTISLALLATVFDFKLCIPLVIMPSLLSNLMVMGQAGGFKPAVARFWPLYLGLGPGLFLGLMLLGSTPSSLAAAGLGAVLLVYAVYGLVGKKPGLGSGAQAGLRAPVGFLTGLVNGLTGSQVMPVLPYLMSLKLRRDEFITAINISFTLSSLVMIFGLNRLGLIDWQIFIYSALGAVPAWLGITWGFALRRRA